MNFEEGIDELRLREKRKVMLLNTVGGERIDTIA